MGLAKRQPGVLGRATAKRRAGGRHHEADLMPARPGLEGRAGGCLAGGGGQPEQHRGCDLGDDGQLVVVVEFAGEAVERFGGAVVFDEEVDLAAVLPPAAVAVGAHDVAPVVVALALWPPGHQRRALGDPGAILGAVGGRRILCFVPSALCVPKVDLCASGGVVAGVGDQGGKKPLTPTRWPRRWLWAIWRGWSRR